MRLDEEMVATPLGVVVVVFTRGVTGRRRGVRLEVLQVFGCGN